jgi:hypothetical protein
MPPAALTFMQLADFPDFNFLFIHLSISLTGLALHPAQRAKPVSFFFSAFKKRAASGG